MILARTFLSSLASLAIVHTAHAQGGAPGAEEAVSIPVPSAAASDIYRRYARGVVKIEVAEIGSSAKALSGSGFFVDAQGHVITNYHVISKLVHHPEHYRVEVHDAAGTLHAAKVLAIDVIHDLAVLSSEAQPLARFSLARAQTSRGDRLFSLGHPGDLGLSIIEGTYNGHLQYTLYPKIHFTGSLNPGMSGGPAIDASGRVIGINVSTQGNQLSFLVPVDRAIALLDTVRAAGFRPSEDFMADVTRQILAYQDEYIGQMLADTVPSVTLGSFELPSAPARFFKCWANATHDEERPYEIARHQCSTDDWLFIADEQSTGIVELEHRVLSSRSLNALRFSALYTYQFDATGEEPYGDKEQVTRFRCTAENVRTESATLRAALCMRRYRNLPGLYDAVVRSAVLGRKGTGVVSVFQLSGVSFENAQRVARRYLERIAWQTK
ncbi:MAG: S1C family serine protease [Gemmatimonadaceae bacterium]